MNHKSKYIDEIYHFKGEWDAPSFCGLKVIQKPSQTIFIVSELYESNPGSSVTSRVTYLALELMEKYFVSHDNMIIIEHNPDRKSNLEFYKETFDIVQFQWDGKGFVNPSWERITAEEVDRMILID